MYVRAIVDDGKIIHQARALSLRANGEAKLVNSIVPDEAASERDKLQKQHFTRGFVEYKVHEYQRWSDPIIVEMSDFRLWRCRRVIG